MIKLQRKPRVECEVLPLRAEDIGAVAAMYREIAVTRENYLEKLTEGERSFRKHGGMFQIQDEQILTGLLHDPDEQVLLAWNDGAPCGLFWFGDFYEEAFHGLQTFPDSVCDDDILVRLGQQGRLGYAKEVIVRASAPGKVTVRRLFLELMRFFQRTGKPYVVGEVYRVEWFEDVHGRHPCGMLNMASYSTLQQTGGTAIGETPLRKIEVDGICVAVHPQVFLWESAKSAALLQALLDETEETE